MWNYVQGNTELRYVTVPGGYIYQDTTSRNICFVPFVVNQGFTYNIGGGAGGPGGASSSGGCGGPASAGASR